MSRDRLIDLQFGEQIVPHLTKAEITMSPKSKVDIGKRVETLFRFADSTSGLKLYAILDGARNNQIYRTLADSDCEYLCVYKDRLPQVMAEAAPYLVHLKQESSFTKWLMANGWGDSWGIFVTAPSDLFDLVTHFRQFVQVQDEEGNTLYFRYYDPRVMRIYLPTCNADELKMVFGPVANFLVEDEAGEGGLIDFRLENLHLINEKISEDNI